MNCRHECQKCGEALEVSGASGFAGLLYFVLTLVLLSRVVVGIWNYAILIGARVGVAPPNLWHLLGLR